MYPELFTKIQSHIRVKLQNILMLLTGLQLNICDYKYTNIPSFNSDLTTFDKQL